MKLFRNFLAARYSSLGEKLEIRNYSNGFTIIEIIVVVSIMAMLSGFMIVYTRGSENQIKILKDKAIFISALYRARSLALRTVTSPGVKVCGYGLHLIDESHFVLWRDLSSSLSCADANRVYDGDGENFEPPIALSKNIIFINRNDSNFMQSILFVPPNPEVIVTPAIMPGEQYKIVIGTFDGKSSTAIGISRFGQAQPESGY